MREIKNELNLKNVQNDSGHNENVIALYKNEIDSLRSGIYFLRANIIKMHKYNFLLL